MSIEVPRPDAALVDEDGRATKALYKLLKDIELNINSHDKDIEELKGS